MLIGLTKKLEKSIKVNKDKLHKILYDKEEMINIDDLDELNKNLSFYFYLIKDNLTTINFIYSIVL